jgi:hypothetical protein
MVRPFWFIAQRMTVMTPKLWALVEFCARLSITIPGKLWMIMQYLSIILSLSPTTTWPNTLPMTSEH